MDRLYLRGKIGQYFYNSTEYLAYAILYRPTPDELIYTKKIKYGEDKLQYYHTYCRKDLVKEKKPLFIYIHGGGWISGITEMRNTYISEWAKKGFFTASISYTYAPEKTFPAQFVEIYKALDHILDRADELKLDTDNIVLAGESAGGYFISYVATCVSDKSRLDKLGIDFKHRDSFKIKAMVSHCGGYDVERLTNPEKKQSHFPDIKMMLTSFMGKRLDEARKILTSDEGRIYSPEVTEDFPPVFFTWGDKDFLRFEAFDFEKELKEQGIKHEIYKCDGIIGMHAWSIVTILKKGKECLKRSFDFVLPHIDGYFEKDGGEWKFEIDD